jgi:hypothetical protein
MTTKLIKLSCGDLLICDTDDEIVTKEGVPFLVVKRPLRMLIGKDGIVLQMWCPCDLEQNVEINLRQIVTSAPAVEPLSKEYRGKFGDSTGIVTPPTPKLVI